MNTQLTDDILIVFQVTDQHASTETAHDSERQVLTGMCQPLLLRMREMDFEIASGRKI
jgi:hypothetical protein